MSWGNELWDKFDEVSTYTEKGIAFCEKFSHFLKERCAIENEYAAKLKKLVKSYQPKKKEENGGRFTANKGFELMIKELFDYAGQHESIAENLQNSVSKELVELVQTLKQERKKLLQDASKQESTLQSHLQQLDKAKKNYEKSFRDAEKALEVYKKGDQDSNLSRAEVEKLKHISTARQQACDDSKKEYASEVEKTRVAQTEHHQVHMPQIFQQFQAMDERRITKVQECIRNSANVEKTTIPIITKCIDCMAESASVVDSKKDSQMVIDKHKTGFTPNLDVPFEDLSNPVKNSNPAPGKLTMSGKHKKRTGLLGIFGGGQKGEEPKDDFSHLPPSQQKKQLTTKVEAIKAQIAKETSARDGMVKMIDVCKGNAKLGDPQMLAKQLDENGQLLDQLRQELNRYEGFLSDAEARLQDSGHTPNASPSIHRKDHEQQSNQSRLSAASNVQEPVPSPTAHVDNDFSDDEFADCGTCTALYDYKGTGDGSMNMAAGQSFTIMEFDQGDGWTQVRSSNGSSGFVPTSYIKIND